MSTDNIIDPPDLEFSEQRQCRSSQNSELNPIILSSSYSQHQSSQQDNQDQGQVLITRRAQSEQAKQRRMQSALQRYKQIEEQEKKQRQELQISKNNHPSKLPNSQIRKELEILKKQFELHSYLPHHTLKQLKQDLDKLNTKYKMEKSTDAYEIQNQSIRFQQRKKLTRAIRLAIQQIKHKLRPEDRTETEATLFKQCQDYLKFSQQLAVKIQTVFYDRLYSSTKNQRKRGELYLKQVKLILMEFSNKYNLQLRRDIICQSVELQHLAFANEDQLKCEQAKADQAEKIKVFLRQNEKIDDNKASIEQQPEPQFLLESIPSINSVKSVTDLYNEKREAANEAKLRQKQKVLSKTKAICKAAHLSTANIAKKMFLRTAKLKTHYKGITMLQNLQDWNLQSEVIFQTS